MGGDCYEAAIETLTGMAAPMNREARVCHGDVTGNGGDALGIRYGHAWVEVAGAIVVDQSNGHDVVALRDSYYRAGSIDPTRVRRYDARDVLARMDAFGHAGPWHISDVAHTHDPDSMDDCPDCGIGHVATCDEAQRLLAETR